MIVRRLLPVFAVCLCALGSSFAANPAVCWEDLPLVRTGVKVRAYSSYNPTGRTYRDFMNYTGRDGADYELALYRGGEGMLVGVWFTDAGEHFSAKNFGNVKLYLSGGKTPDYSKLRDDYFGTSIFPNLQPLWGQAFRARWAFPGLAFKSQFKATSTEVPHWYQFTCHLYREGRFSEAITREQLEDFNARVARANGAFPGSDQGDNRAQGKLTLAAQQTQPLLKIGASGVIRSIRLKLADVSSAVLDKLWIQVMLDNEPAPVVDVPLSVFFGGYEQAPIANAKGLPAGFDGEHLYFYFPMPFWEWMSIELENRSDKKVAVDYDIGYSEVNNYDARAAGIFKIQYNSDVAVKAGEPDFGHLKVKGSGHIVGASANLAGSIEGNFRTYIDGAKTPAIETTGGEDYFCHAFGIKVGLCTPFHGGLKDKCGYRFHILDYIPFLSSVYFGQDHAHDYSHDRDGAFKSAVFYYHNPAELIGLTDTLDVGDAASEKAHKYKITGDRMRLQNERGAYEGNFKEPFEDSGRWTDGTTSFVVKINPDNDGVRLRKRINQLAYHQAVEVFVDGKPVGMWFEQGSQYQLFKEKQPTPHYLPDWNKIDKRFRDTEFEIGASFTKGKSEIELKFKTSGSKAALGKADEGLSNEYFYWIYSYKGL